MGKKTTQSENISEIQRTYNILIEKFQNLRKNNKFFGAAFDLIHESIGLDKQNRSKYWIFWLITTISLVAYNISGHRGFGAVLLSFVIVGTYTTYLYLGGRYVLKPTGVGYLLYLAPIFLLWQTISGQPLSTTTSSSNKYTQSSDVSPTTQQSSNNSSSTSSVSEPVDDTEYVVPDNPEALKLFLEKLPHTGMGYTLTAQGNSADSVKFYIDIKTTARPGATEYDYQLEQAHRAAKDYMEHNNLTPINYYIHLTINGEQR